MFRNYVKTAVRNLLKEKTHSTINILGLAVGIACCVLILLYVRHELSYDAFHTHKDQIYRAYCNIELSNRTITTPNLPMPFGPALENEIPEIDATVRLQQRTGVIRADQTLVREEILFADPTFFDVFTFALVAGTRDEGLQAPGAIVLSREMSNKYFGEENPIGRQMAVRLQEEELMFTVTGVAENAPENSSLKFDFLVPYARLALLSEGARVRANDWTSYNTVTFVKVDTKSDLAQMQSKLPAFSKKNFPENGTVTIELQPMTDIHLNPELGSGGLEPVSDPAYSYILAGIALMVLLIACINFMTLSLGRSSTRAREVGMRKVLGAKRFQLMKQFWSESLLMSFLALIVGVAIAEFFLPTFNFLTTKSLDLDIFSDGMTLLGLISVMLLTGIVAGSYPALLISKHQAVEVFKDKFKIGSATTFGKFLVVTQFALSIFLIIVTLILSRQTDYLMTKNLGFNQEQVVVIPTIKEGNGEKLLELYRNELRSNPNIANISATAFSIDRGSHRVIASFDGQDIRAYEFRVDYGYLATMGIELLKGRNFSREHATDATEAAIVNEALVKEFGWENPVGQTFEFRGTRNLQVVGVVRDYHFESLRKEISPVVLHMDSATPLRYLLVRMTPDDVPGTVSLLKSKWQEFAPNLPFEYAFLDNDVARQYQAEQRWGKIVRYSSLFAIVIACLGLFGLSALSVARRTKELGIRKVLGATVSGLVGLINREFVIPVAFGNLIAWPAAWLVMHRWLHGFAYRVEISAWTFVMAGLLTVMVAILTVSVQALRGALVNPVESLRYE